MGMSHVGGEVEAAWGCHIVPLHIRAKPEASVTLNMYPMKVLT